MNPLISKIQKKMTELVKRTLFAIPAGALFLWMAWKGQIYFWAFMLVITLFTQVEIYRIIKYANNPINFSIAMILTLWFFVTPFIPEPMMFGILIFLVMISAELFSKREDSLAQLLNTTFCGMYAPIGLLSLWMLRDLGNNQEGMFIVFTVLLMIWGNDVFAYFGGRKFGKHKMAPKISPKKSWEGFFSGFIGSFVGYGIALLLLPGGGHIHWIAVIAMVILAGIFGPIGDLTASKFKRAAEVKDSSTLLPGHGGFYDRFDSTLIVAPAILAFFKLATAFGWSPFI